MPEFRIPDPLTDFGGRRLAKLVQTALVRIDARWKFSNKEKRSSPISPVTARNLLPASPTKTESSNVFQSYGSSELVQREQRILRDCLLQLPIHLLEDVVQKVVDLVELDINEDKDRKIILTLINIEKTNPSHFSFGVYFLLMCLARTRISKLPFSTRLWFCIWEFEQLTTSNHLRHCLSESIPLLTNLVTINFAYIATDQIIFLLCKHCPLLEDLCLDHSSVSDRCVRFFCGWELPCSSRNLVTSSDIGCWQNLVFSTSSTSSQSTSFSLSSQPVLSANPATAGCPNLKYLSLQGCSSITDSGIWCLLEHKLGLQVLRYHQAFSVAEILCKNCRTLLQSPGHADDDKSATTTAVTEIMSPAEDVPCENVTDETRKDLKRKQLSLRVFDHPFPYGLNLDLEVITQVANVCPDICTLNLVSSDSSLPDYAKFNKVTKVALELEDCFGIGLYKFLEKLGSQLTDLTLSCSSDTDSTFLEGGGQPFQLFNVGLRLVRRFCPLAMQVNISGCGLVSNTLLQLLEKERQEEEAKISREKAYCQQLRSLIILTYYDDDVQVQTCEHHLLLDILQASKQLECLSLEGNFSSFLGDGFVAKVLERNRLANLRIFDVRGRAQVPLSLNAAKLFIQLPKIRELRMYSWNISDAEFHQLKDEVKKVGWDLLLTKKPVMN